MDKAKGRFPNEMGSPYVPVLLSIVSNSNLAKRGQMLAVKVEVMVVRAEPP